MNRQRPTVVLVMAILNFVFGGLGFFWVICAGLGLLVVVSLAKNAPPPPGGGRNPLADLSEMFNSIPGFIPYTIIASILGLIVDIVLIVAGIGLLKMKPWARWTCVAYGFYGIVASLGGLVYTLTVVNPAMAQWQQKQAAGAGGNTGFNNAVSHVSAMLGMAYAVALLIVMFLPNVSAAFAGRVSAPPDSLEDGWGQVDTGGADDRFRRG
ncbi:MAG TPA: hypothetical protein VKI65_16495 [Gemmataceae bacterium]|nr:hypothetical protein [Gemmataceae bacterium]